MESTKETTISAMFLVGGTCIGGGMLALPVATGVNGFIPSLAIMLLCCLAMMMTGLLLLEVTLWMEDEVHISTMTSRLLGKWAKILSWCLFLFVSYASIVAYTAGAGSQLMNATQHLFGWKISKEVACLLFILIFGAIVDAGSRLVGRVNSILFIAMITSYIGLVGMGLDEVKATYLWTHRWSGAFMAIPLLLTAFSFQTMVPSLTPYLKKNVKSLRFAIIGGCLIAFVIYAIWQWLILGIVPPTGPNSLSEALIRGEPANQFLSEHVHGYWVAPFAHFFAFFAIVTSFLGMSLGLFDFLSDGLHIKKEGLGRLWLGLLIIIPTWIFATQFERIFLLALDTTGGFGDTILNGMIPVLMVWVGRYKLGHLNHICVPGGKFVLTLIFTFFFGVLVYEVLALSGQIPSIYETYELFEHNMGDASA